MQYKRHKSKMFRVDQLGIKGSTQFHEYEDVVVQHIRSVGGVRSCKKVSNAISKEE